MGKLMIIGVAMVGAVAAVIGERLGAPREGSVPAAARALIAAERAVPRCSDLLEAVLEATAGGMR
jgi:hypothetical protein